MPADKCASCTGGAVIVFIRCDLIYNGHLY